MGQDKPTEESTASSVVSSMDAPREEATAASVSSRSEPPKQLKGPPIGRPGLGKGSEGRETTEGTGGTGAGQRAGCGN